jgi:probable rRNA maturation factor
MHVEVNLQNCCSAEVLISPETWEIWFHRWLTHLDPHDRDDQLPLHPQRQYELSLRLTDDREIHSFNHQYRQKDQPTDVLAFASLEVNYPQLAQANPSLNSLDAGCQEPLYLGDVLISVETAQRQAQEHQHPLEVELAWLAVHGLLHLLGWDHPDEERLIKMLHQQQCLLETIGYPVANVLLEKV